MENKINKNKAQNIIELINSSGAIITEGAISVLSAIDSGNSEILKIILKSGVKNKKADKILAAAKRKNIKTEFFSAGEMLEFEQNIKNTGLYTLGKTHGGIIAVTSKRRFLSPRELMEILPESPKYVSAAIIEGIEDPYNLGYAARALYTQGVGALILPERDFGFSESVIERASTGTFSKMPVAVFSNNKNNETNAKIDLINILKQERFKIYCIDKKIPANSNIKTNGLFGVKFADRTVFIIGGEKRGISKDFLEHADEIVSIPYAKKFPHSLAAQTAATIISYEIHRQRELKLIEP
ncbi:MAG: hypothetical protein FWH10_03525 [Oscillospiraceae bacterium]|nr:hypothetical protein [Oscillospiraceae bacterium]